MLLDPGIIAPEPKGCYVERMETVDVFIARYGACDAGFTQMLRKRQLNQNAVYRRIGIQRLDILQNLKFRSIFRQSYLYMPYSGLLTGSGFVPHIDLTRRVSPDDDYRQGRDSSEPCLESGYLLRNPGDYFIRQFFSTNRHTLTKIIKKEVRLAPDL